MIAFNALLMGFETDYEWGGWAVIENFLLCTLAAPSVSWLRGSYHRSSLLQVSAEPVGGGESKTPLKLQALHCLISESCLTLPNTNILHQTVQRLLAIWHQMSSNFTTSLNERRFRTQAAGTALRFTDTENPRRNTMSKEVAQEDVLRMVGS